MVGKRGFTLIEVLISLTLLSLVLGAVYVSFFTVQRVTERFDNVSVKYHEARNALDIIRREIESAVLKNDFGSADKTFFRILDKDSFGKKSSALQLTAFSFRGFLTNSVTYFVKEVGGRLVLYKTEKSSVLDGKGYTIEVIEDIEGFSVETLFNNRWVMTWDSSETDELPETVRVSIYLDDSGTIVKLTEYARPMIGKQL